MVRIIFDLIFVFTQILLNIRLIFDDLFRVNVFIPHNLSEFLDIINLFLWLFPHNDILRMIFLNLIIFFWAIFLFLWIRNLFIWLSDAWALLSWFWILNIFDLQIFLCIFDLVIKRAVLIRLFLIFIILLIIHWLIFVLISFRFSWSWEIFKKFKIRIIYFITKVLCFNLVYGFIGFIIFMKFGGLIFLLIFYKSLNKLNFWYTLRKYLNFYSCKLFFYWIFISTNVIFLLSFLFKKCH